MLGEPLPLTSRLGRVAGSRATQKRAPKPPRAVIRNRRSSPAVSSCGACSGARSAARETAARLVSLAWRALALSHAAGHRGADGSAAARRHQVLGAASSIVPVRYQDGRTGARGVVSGRSAARPCAAALPPQPRGRAVLLGQLRAGSRVALCPNRWQRCSGCFRARARGPLRVQPLRPRGCAGRS